MNQPAAAKQQTKPAAAPKKGKVIGYELEVEGSYWGSGIGGHMVQKPYSVKMLVPANYNDGGRGATFVKKALLGKITGRPHLLAYKDKEGNPLYGDYRQLRTHNIVDWTEVTDASKSADIIRQKKPDEMSADELKAALTKLGVTYPNPARKSELVALLIEAAAKGPASADDRPDYVRPLAGVAGAENLDKTADTAGIGEIFDSSDVDPNTGLPKLTDKSVEGFTS